MRAFASSIAWRQDEILDADGYIVKGAPELIVEIAASSVSFDLGAKLGRLSCRNFWRRGNILCNGRMTGGLTGSCCGTGSICGWPPMAKGVYRSEIFPGLWLHAEALVAGRLADVLTVLQRGIASAEHGEFVKHLASASQSG